MKRHLDETEVRPQTMGHGKAKRGIPSKSENFNEWYPFIVEAAELCLLYTSPSPRDVEESRMPSSA